MINEIKISLEGGSVVFNRTDLDTLLKSNAFFAAQLNAVIEQVNKNTQALESSQNTVQAENSTELKKELTDIINSAPVRPDCSGRWDLDAPLLQISTRGWEDNSCKCEFMLGDGNPVYCELLTSDYIQGVSKEDCLAKARQWYLDNLGTALKMLTSSDEESTTTTERLYTQDEAAEILDACNVAPCNCINPDIRARFNCATDWWCSKYCKDGNVGKDGCWKHALQSGLLEGVNE